MGKDLGGKELGKCISQRKDGRFCVKIQIRGVRREYHYNTVTEARHGLRTMRAEIAKTDILPATKTVQAWFLEWQVLRKPIMAARSFNSRVGLYNKHIKPALGNMRICNVRPADCQRILNGLTSKCSAGTIKQVRAAMCDIFGLAVDNRLIASSPVTRSVVVPRNASGPKSIELPTDAELDRFYGYITGKAHEAVYKFVLETGLRLGEITGLCWSNVDLDKRVLGVEQQLYHDHAPGSAHDPAHWHFGKPKSAAGIRTLPLTDTACQILQNLREHPQITHETPENMRDLVFLEKGWPIMDRTLHGHLGHVCKTLQLPHIHMHTLRHIFATHALLADMDVATLSKILGHSSPAVTLSFYIHSDNARMTAAVSKMGVSVAEVSWETARI